MASNLEVLGPESSVLYYNLNKQFSNIKKLIITKELVLDSFENSQVREVFETMSGTDLTSYSQKLSECDLDSVFSNASFDTEFYKKIQESLGRMYEEINEVKLKDYNFMSAVSNTKFNVVLRSQSFSVSKHYVEKGAILNSIKNLLKSYLEFEGNAFSISRLNSFQIEVFEAVEEFKHVFLKKEGESLILCSSFGFMKPTPIDHNLGPELYYSKGEAFNFFQNAQTTAILREHTKILEEEINTQEKTLSNEDLVSVNDNTKNINDALIEMYISKKNDLKIVNVSLLESSIGSGNERGFVMHKSSKNNTKISIVTLRDNLEDHYPYPKYLLIRNQDEVRELLEGIRNLRNFDGLIFNTNFSHAFIDKIGSIQDMDIIFYKDKLQKSMDASLDTLNVSIGGAESISDSNPFSSIIEEQTKQQNEILERLNNVDLSTPPSRPSPQESMTRNEVSSIAQGIISSPNSSTSTMGSYASSGGASSLPSSFGSGEKKSAISMLADNVMNNGGQPVREPEPVQQQPQQTDFSSSSLVMEGVTSNDLNPLPTDVLDTLASEPEPIQQQPLNMGEVMATKILTTPAVDSTSYFVDMNTIGKVSGGELYYLVTNPQDMQNPNLNYILPISLSTGMENNCHLLINNPVDYFLVKDDSKEYFVNLTHVEPNLRESFLQENIRRFGKCCVIILKEDIDKLADCIDKIDIIFIKDLATNAELTEIKSKLASFEQRKAQGSGGFY